MEEGGDGGGNLGFGFEAVAGDGDLGFVVEWGADRHVLLNGDEDIFTRFAGHEGTFVAGGNDPVSNDIVGGPQAYGHATGIHIIHVVAKTRSSATTRDYDIRELPYLTQEIAFNLPELCLPLPGKEVLDFAVETLLDVEIEVYMLEAGGSGERTAESGFAGGHIAGDEDRVQLN